MSTLFLGLFLAVLGPNRFFDKPETTEVSCLFAGRPTVADFNNDGFMDAAFVNIFLPLVDGSFVTYLGDGQGRFHKGGRHPVVGGTGPVVMASCITAGDFDGDGNADVACGDTLGRLWLFPGRGDDTFGQPVLAALGFVKRNVLDGIKWNMLDSFDYDRDGRDEILGQFTILDWMNGPCQEPLTLYKYAPGFRLQAWKRATFGQVKAFARADIDRDGWDDFIVAAGHPTAVQTYCHPDLYFWKISPAGSKVKGPFIPAGAPASIGVVDAGPGAGVRAFLAAEKGPCQLIAITRDFQFSSLSTLGMAGGGRVYNFARFAELDGKGRSFLVLMETDDSAHSVIRVHEFDGGRNFRLLESIGCPGVRCEPGNSFIEPARLADLTHDGNPDLACMTLKSSRMGFSLLRNRSGFRNGFSYLPTPRFCGGVRLAPIHGPVVPGNRRFGLRLLGERGGFVAWNLVDWTGRPLCLGATALSVPPRLLVPIGEVLPLPIPGDARFLNPLSHHYFQWISSRGDRVSEVLHLRFSP